LCSRLKDHESKSVIGDQLTVARAPRAGSFTSSLGLGGQQSVGTKKQSGNSDANGGPQMKALTKRLWQNEEGQDIAEYAVMLAVILVIVIGTIRLIGGNANNVFSQVSSSISQ
jgi:Flp pilus assembly pilin Flp